MLLLAEVLETVVRQRASSLSGLQMWMPRKKGVVLLKMKDGRLHDGETAPELESIPR